MKKRISAERTVERGVMISEFATASVTRIFDSLGYSFAIIDCEHGSFDYSQVATLCTAAAGFDIEVLVRVPDTRREQAKYLDMGADGLVIPMVETASQAEEAVRLAKYPPLGARGVSVTRAHSGYQVDDLPSYLKQANKSTKIFVQIETVKAVSQLSQIASVDGLTGMLVGPNDLLQDLGVPGQASDPRIGEYVKQVGSTADEFGLISGIITANKGLLETGMRSGMTVMCQGSDVGLMMAGARAASRELSELAIQ